MNVLACLQNAIQQLISLLPMVDLYYELGKEHAALDGWYVKLCCSYSVTDSETPSLIGTNAIHFLQPNQHFTTMVF